MSDTATQRPAEAMASAATGTTSDPALERQRAIRGVVPYVNVSDANAAADLYAKAFGAKVIQKTPGGDGKRLIHCYLEINGGPLFINDPFPEFGYPSKEPQSFSLHLQVDDVEAWWKRAVDAGLEVTMPMATQFWGDRYGQLRDRFGVSWSIGGA